jgi:hypothetical protein
VETGQNLDVFSICYMYSATMTEVEIIEVEILGRRPVCMMISPESQDLKYALVLNPA